MDSNKEELNNYISKIGFKTQVISIDEFHNPLEIRNRIFLDVSFDEVLSRAQKRVLLMCGH